METSDTKHCKMVQEFEKPPGGYGIVPFWHMPRTNAPYLCIEPWTSLPSRKNVVEDLAKQEDLVLLSPGERYINQWEIEVLVSDDKVHSGNL